MTTCCYVNSGQSNTEFEYLGEFETEFEITSLKYLGYEEGPRRVRLMKKGRGKNLLLPTRKVFTELSTLCSRQHKVQSAGPVRFLIFCSISIIQLASLVAGRRPQYIAGADKLGMYSTIPIH